MSNRTSWTHIRTSYLHDDVRKGLEARIADPLWTLARQWQLGEFDGDDAASPIKIKVRHGSVSVGGLASPRTPNAKHPIKHDDLIEPLIEAAPAENGPARPRMAGEAGLQLLRMMRPQAREAALRKLQAAYPLTPGDAIDAKSEKLLGYLVRGAFDGLALRAAIGTLPARLAQLTGLAQREADKIAASWVAYVDGRFADQVGDGFWEQDHLEHRARLHAQQGNAVDIILATDEHTGGDLDWHAFDIPRGGAKGNAGEPQEQETLWLLPTPISYSGMPAERFWDFEDGEVFFGGITLEKTDLAQLVLTEFATVYSNDWFMMPVPVETGTLNRIISVEVFDTFGDVTRVNACATEDTGARPWRFFELAGDPSAKDGVAPWLYIPRGISGGDHSRPVELVMFTRDEMANLAWGIEQIVESPAGEPINRDQHWKRVRDDFPDYTGEGDLPEETGDPERDTAWRYRLLTTAPPHWIPFAPEIINNIATGRLVRSRMGEWELLGTARDTLAGPQGRIMDPGAPMVVEEEELMRGGIEVARRYESARTPDGRLLIWASRRKRPASGEKSSGRVTDVIRTKTNS